MATAQLSASTNSMDFVAINSIASLNKHQILFNEDTRLTCSGKHLHMDIMFTTEGCSFRCVHGLYNEKGMQIQKGPITQVFSHIFFDISSTSELECKVEFMTTNELSEVREALRLRYSVDLFTTLQRFEFIDAEVESTANYIAKVSGMHVIESTKLTQPEILQSTYINSVRFCYGFNATVGLETDTYLWSEYTKVLKSSLALHTMLELGVPSLTDPKRYLELWANVDKIAFGDKLLVERDTDTLLREIEKYSSLLQDLDEKCRSFYFKLADLVRLSLVAAGGCCALLPLM